MKMSNPVDASRYTKKESVKTGRPEKVAMLTKWALEKTQDLSRYRLTASEIVEEFQRDTGYKTTHYTVKQIFEALDIPFEQRHRWTKDRRNPVSKLDRLIKEVHILSERLAALAQSLGNTEGFVTTEGLTALRNRKGSPRSTSEKSREERKEQWPDKDEQTFS